VLAESIVILGVFLVGILKPRREMDLHKGENLCCVQDMKGWDSSYCWR